MKSDDLKPKPSMSNCHHVDMPVSAMEPVSRAISRSKGFWHSEGRFDNPNVWASDYFLKNPEAAMKLSKRAPGQLPTPDVCVVIAT